MADGNVHFESPHRLLEILLRLPPLYLMDAILLSDLGLGALPSYASESHRAMFEGQKIRFAEAPAHHNSGLSPEEAQNLIRNEAYNSSGLEDLYEQLYGNPEHNILPYLLGLIFATTLYVASMFMVILHMRHLLVCYSYLLAFVCIPLSYLSHYIMMDTLKQLEANSDPSNAEWFIHKHFTSLSLLQLIDLSLQSKVMITNYFIQSGLCVIFSSVMRFHFVNASLLLKGIAFSLVSPILLVLIGVPYHWVDWSVLIAIAVPSLMIAIVMSSISKTAMRVLITIVRNKRLYVSNFGLNTFLENEWNRLRVPALLRTFWMTRIGLQLVIEVQKTSGANYEGFVDIQQLMDHTQHMGKNLITSGASTVLTVLGLTSIVSSICHYIGSFFYLLLSAGEEEEKSVASVSAVLFFVLALQTGLTSLEPNKRFARLGKNFCLLLTALFHFIHGVVSPILMSLSASNNYNSKKHIRALFICLFLVIAPIFLMFVLWQIFHLGTWLLAVSAFCIEVVVKVTVTVGVYLLFLYDQYYQAGTWEFLDDAVYYVKAVGNSVEFCFAVFLFFNGGWILLFESGGTIRALMMIIHAYCNIWLEAKAGWQTFIKRRTAVAKVNSLRDATLKQLEEHNDVCAICYQDMTAAKKTLCHHYFHAVCLRKWLYVQDSCPLCHGALYHKSALVHNEEDSGEAGAAQISNLNDSNEVIDNDEVEDIIEEDVDIESIEDEEVDLDEVKDNTVCDDYSTDNEHSDNDLIYDSMEDFGESSGDEIDHDEGNPR